MTVDQIVHTLRRVCVKANVPATTDVVICDEATGLPYGVASITEVDGKIMIALTEEA